MALHSFTHIALRVERLRDAETFCAGLFGLDVAWREAETPDGRLTRPRTRTGTTPSSAGPWLDLGAARSDERPG